MVSRVSLGRLPGSKVRQNGGPDMDLYDFRKLFPRSFGDTLEMLHVFFEKQIDSIRC